MEDSIKVNDTHLVSDIFVEASDSNTNVEIQTRENIVHEVNSSKWRQIKKTESSQAANYREVQKKLLLEKSAKNTQNIELFLKKESATVNLSLNVDTVEIDYEKETPVITSQLAPPEEVVDSTAFTTQKSLALIVPQSKSSSSVLKNRDVALFRGTDTVVDDSMKKQLIKEGFYQLGIEYKFPQSSKDNRSFQFNWLNRFNWLAYSEKEEGAYCKFCVIYAPDLIAQHTFISKPHKKYRTAIEDYL
ncbi:hypothetical protein AVEN_94342-1 [Araneus ventricosus]|uniref:TTF-type domain-containing protein n=1 Tax=Araneus ventricosus TaxID=182803 RepID=A0A4Y2EDH5_ARAVE|nr:hypothetical protein AVEN_94342-1 [Araneus ventricosus]